MHSASKPSGNLDIQGEHGNPGSSASNPLSSSTRDVAAQSKQQSVPSRSTQTPAKPPKLPKPIYHRWWVWMILLLGATAGGGAIAAQETIKALNRKLPNAAEALTFVRDGTMTLKAADGTILQQMGPATRSKLTFDQIPPLMTEAFIASEDKQFYQHNGVDYQAIVRAIVANVSAGEVVEGGSTITQQLARIVFLDQDRSLDRKMREALLAQKIERELSKKQILERYLNLVYLGSGAYGIADAAWIYFSKPVKDLTLSEMAMIAGLPPAPSVFSPLVDLKAARQRQSIVLARMVEAGFITASEMERAIATPVTLKPSSPRNLYSPTPYFTSYIQQQLPQYVSAEELERGGLTIETTLNLKWQKQAQETISHAIKRYGPGQNFSQAALVCIDPKTGEIKALVGGNDFNKSQFNRATQAQRQPGSTFKALVYTTAIAAGFSPYKPYVDAKLVVDGYEPHNYGKGYRGTVSMRDALISSINIVAVKTLIDVGFAPVIQMAHRMGIKSELIPAYSLALGSSEVNLLELTSAYGTLAAAGNHIAPHGIVRILDRHGKAIYQADFKPERAVDEDTAAIMTWMLQGVVQSGTGQRASLRGREVAGKTGTSELRRDLWFVGYIPQVVTGIWLGNDNNHPTWGASSTAALTWHDFMQEILDQIPVQKFPSLPQLGGRRGTLRAQPVKPRRVVSGGADDESNNGNSVEQRSQHPREESPPQDARSESASSDRSPSIPPGKTERQSPVEAPPAVEPSTPVTSQEAPPPAPPPPEPAPPAAAPEPAPPPPAPSSP